MSLERGKWNNLLYLCEQKIWIKPPEEEGPVKWSDRNGGNYLGAPGREIFFCLPELDEHQWDELAEKHAKQWPTPKEGQPYKTPGNHVGFAACIRYIYGQFEKQGIMRSKEDKKRMQRDGVDWTLPQKFIDTLREKFVANGCDYGMCITYEMEAHRIGDSAILAGRGVERAKLLDKMAWTYIQSVKHAEKCNSYKQYFTPHYWAAKYFMEADDERAKDYSVKAIKRAEDFCPDARGSYVSKLVDCAQYLKSKHPGAWRKLRARMQPTAKNRVTKKMFSKVK